MSHSIILLSGPQAAGKTTLSDALLNHLYGVPGIYGKGLIFADALYKMHDFIRGVIADSGIEHPVRLEKKDGNLLQYLGTEFGRKTYGQNIWVEILKSNMNKYLRMRHDSDRIVFVISDCRFENEFDAFPEALRVRLKCPENIRKERASMWRDNTKHPSEIDLDNYDRNGLFDLYLDTEKTPIEGCVHLIMAQIQKGNWVEKR